MKAFIWMEVQCSHCDSVIGWDYTNAKSVSALKKATKDWIFDRDFGNLCPECQKKIKSNPSKKDVNDSKQVLKNKER